MEEHEWDKVELTEGDHAVGYEQRKCVNCGYTQSREVCHYKYKSGKAGWRGQYMDWKGKSCDEYRNIVEKHAKTKGLSDEELDKRYGYRKGKGAWAKKLDKPLYHGTSELDARLINVRGGFKPYVYVTENPVAAEHYAQARTARAAQECKEHPPFYDWIRKFGENPEYAVYEFKTLPDKAELVKDDYHPEEKGQYIVLGHVTPTHYGKTYKKKPLTKDKNELVRLQAFAICMNWGDRPKSKKRR